MQTIHLLKSAANTKAPLIDAVRIAVDSLALQPFVDAEDEAYTIMAIIPSFPSFDITFECHLDFLNLFLKQNENVSSF